MSNEELLEYRVAQLEKRMVDQERARRGRPMMVATIIMGACALVQGATTALVAVGVFR